MRRKIPSGHWSLMARKVEKPTINGTGRKPEIGNAATRKAVVERGVIAAGPVGLFGFGQQDEQPIDGHGICD